MDARLGVWALRRAGIAVMAHIGDLAPEASITWISQSSMPRQCWSWGAPVAGMVIRTVDRSFELQRTPMQRHRVRSQDGGLH